MMYEANPSESRTDSSLRSPIPSCTNTRSLTQRIATIAAEAPERVASRAAHDEPTYAALDRRTRRLAADRTPSPGISSTMPPPAQPSLHKAAE